MSPMEGERRANMCGKVADARKAVDAGCDLVIAQGTEGGDEYS